VRRFPAVLDRSPSFVRVAPLAARIRPVAAILPTALASSPVSPLRRWLSHLVRLLTTSVGFRACELEPHDRVIAGNPRVASRFNHICIAGRELSFGSIVVDHTHPASHDRSNVARLTRFGAGRRKTALR
jgi:hypothetical protein